LSLRKDAIALKGNSVKIISMAMASMSGRMKGSTTRVSGEMEDTMA
jgi:hypothetical protein